MANTAARFGCRSAVFRLRPAGGGNGVAYVSTGANDVFALAIDSGEILWQYSARLDPAITSVCCGWNNKGVAISDDKVFIGQLDGKLVALNRTTGQPAWSIQAERWQDNFSITSAPVYFNGLVITGFAGADRGTPADASRLYDANDGRLVWTFYTIPGPGEPGHDSWPANSDAWKFGGASVWQTPAIDPGLGLVDSRPETPAPTTTARRAPATISTRPRSSRLTRRPASTGGTFSRFITTSGTTTRPIRSS